MYPVLTSDLITASQSATNNVKLGECKSVQFFHTPLKQRDETDRANPRVEEVIIVLVVMGKIRHQRYDSKRKIKLVK